MTAIVPLIEERMGEKVKIEKVNGFVLKEQCADAMDGNELCAFRHHVPHIGQLDTGCVSGKHCDESKWTVDICLGGDFENGSLDFYIDGKDKEQSIQIKHSIGSMLVFSGNTMHSVTPITKG